MEIKLNNSTPNTVCGGDGEQIPWSEYRKMKDGGVHDEQNIPGSVCDKKYD